MSLPRLSASIASLGLALLTATVWGGLAAAEAASPDTTWKTATGRTELPESPATPKWSPIRQPARVNSSPLSLSPQREAAASGAGRFGSTQPASTQAGSRQATTQPWRLPNGQGTPRSVSPNVRAAAVTEPRQFTPPANATRLTPNGNAVGRMSGPQAARAESGPMSSAAINLAANRSSSNPSTRRPPTSTYGRVTTPHPVHGGGRPDSAGNSPASRSMPSRLWGSIAVAFQGPESPAPRQTTSPAMEAESLPMPPGVHRGEMEMIEPGVGYDQDFGGGDYLEGSYPGDITDACPYPGGCPGPDGYCERGPMCGDGMCGCGPGCGCGCGIEPGCSCELDCGCGGQGGCACGPNCRCNSRYVTCGYDNCDMNLCGKGDPESCTTIRIGVPKWQDMTLFAGVQGFKGPYDWNRDSGNFGFHEGINTGYKVPFATLGYQIGYRATQSQLNGDKDTGINDPHTQQFVTAGVFRRVKDGFQGGVVWDLLRDERWGAVDFHQLRAEVSFMDQGCHEIGFAAAIHLNDSELFFFNSQEDLVSNLFQPSDQYLLFYRFHSCRGGEGRFYGGFNDDSDGIIGADALLPLQDRWSLTGGFTYLIPQERAGRQGAAAEAWNVGMALVWHYDCAARRSHKNCYRPLFNVADNGSMIIDRRPGSGPIE